MREHAAIHRRFTAALDALVDHVKADRTILAALLCGSLSHDTVWEKSDIDLVLVTEDDAKVNGDGLALFADGLNIHAILMTRAEFRKAVEGAARNSFVHSFPAKGRLLYTHDPTVADLCARLHGIGARDSALQMRRAATAARPPVYKAHKWFVTRRDLDYTALWILYAATPLAQMEVFGRRLPCSRRFSTITPRLANREPASVAPAWTPCRRGRGERTVLSGQRLSSAEDKRARNKI
ncbi:MAG TPA: hypothetical protein VFX12_08990 [Vicinamibacterales bacterium]|nr:hypothetical protein [Vicinamibacterales bacterium]